MRVVRSNTYRPRNARRVRDSFAGGKGESFSFHFYHEAREYMHINAPQAIGFSETAATPEATKRRVENAMQPHFNDAASVFRVVTTNVERSCSARCNFYRLFGSGIIYFFLPQTSRRSNMIVAV